MKVGIATDHGGFETKQVLEERLKAANYTIVDFGNKVYDSSDDYPDYAIPLAKAVASGEVDRGIAICGSGVGVAVAANKVKGARACLIHDHFAARQGVEDDDLNILCLGGRVIGNETAFDMAITFLEAEFTNEDRHKRRLQKVLQAEANFSDKK